MLLKRNDICGDQKIRYSPALLRVEVYQKLFDSGGFLEAAAKSNSRARWLSLRPRPKALGMIELFNASYIFQCGRGRA